MVKLFQDDMKQVKSNYMLDFVEINNKAKLKNEKFWKKKMCYGYVIYLRSYG